MREKTMLAVLIAASANLAGCAVVRGVFKAGVWTGVILLGLVALVVAGGVALFRRARPR